MTSSRRVSIKAWVVALVCVLAFAGCALAGVSPEQQFHAIVASEVYRSAQPSADEIRAYRNKYHIATIINLRCETPGQPWYDAEVAGVSRLVIPYILGTDRRRW
ncbi:hypothetical protein [Mesorhizobium escarrei]|uniref:Uncharacterized protein n=1 Tax=Mesorhizobium escarrei TaxID=666018 RepID=A0ABN8K769_9HYPH|nr:hypothetical protein [Mesorhizobium escarrei]CAH2406097.1 exported hypothetical protein [Mesorhizobium escarrei]